MQSKEMAKSMPSRLNQELAEVPLVPFTTQFADSFGRLSWHDQEIRID